MNMPLNYQFRFNRTCKTMFVHCSYQDEGPVLGCWCAGSHTPTFFAVVGLMWISSNLTLGNTVDIWINWTFRLPGVLTWRLRLIKVLIFRSFPLSWSWAVADSKLRWNIEASLYWGKNNCRLWLIESTVPWVSVHCLWSKADWESATWVTWSF